MDIREQKRKSRRRRWLIRSICALAGAGLGYLCVLAPPAYQTVCHIAAKLLALFGGSSA